MNRMEICLEAGRAVWRLQQRSSRLKQPGVKSPTRVDVVLLPCLTTHVDHYLQDTPHFFLANKFAILFPTESSF